jgi:dihydroflavonol-4-reductase
MKAFITGSNGFIGSHLASRLAARGDTVVCLVRDPSKVEGMNMSPNIQWVKGDVTEPDSVREAMRGSDVVFHVAGLFKYGPKFIPQMRGVNVEGARNVLQMAADLGVPKIIHTSSVAVFGNTRGKIVDETYRGSKNDMGSEYERTKWEAHYEVAVPMQQKGAPVIIAQPGGVTGAGDTGAHMGMVNFYLNRSPVGMGEKSGVTFAHVDDIADGHILLAERGKIGEAYILAGPTVTWKQIFEEFEKITGIPGPKVWLPGWTIPPTQALMGVFEGLGMHMAFAAESLGSLNNYTYWGKADKAKRELGWTSRPLQETFRDMLEYEMKKRGIK